MISKRRAAARRRRRALALDGGLPPLERMKPPWRRVRADEVREGEEIMVGALTAQGPPPVFESTWFEVDSIIRTFGGRVTVLTHEGVMVGDWARDAEVTVR